MQNYKLTEAKIGKATVIVDILPKGKVIPNTVIKPTSITIHNTGNIGAPAKNNHSYMSNLNKSGERTASWHFTVDDQFIYQAVPTNMKAWHAGCAAGNNSSIGIEICMLKDAERQKQAYLNAIELVKILMRFHGFTTNQIKQHYNWTKKDCPTWLRSGKYGFTWQWFINACNGKASQVINKPTNTTPKPFQASSIPSNGAFKPFIAKCNVNKLNGRVGPGTNYTIQSVITIGTAVTIIEEKMNGNTKWYKTKSGYWVSAQYMTFVKYV